MGEMDQDDIDKLLADALGGDAGSLSFDGSDGGAQSQDEIDALIAAAAGGGDLPPGSKPAASAASAAPAADEGMQSQSDIDALIAAAAGAGPDSQMDDSPSAPAGQDDIDAILAAAGGDDDGMQSQDDIDALIAAAGGGAPAPKAPAAKAPAAKPAADEDDSSASQSDIDALLAGMNAGGDDPLAGLTGGAGDDAGGMQSQDDIDALVAAASGAPAKPAAKASAPEPEQEEDAAGMGQSDIDALLAGNQPAVGLGETNDTALTGGMAQDLQEEETDGGIDDLLGGLGGLGGAGDESAEDELAGMASAAEELQKTIASPERNIAPQAEAKYVPPVAPAPAMSAAPRMAPRAPAPVPQLSDAQLANIQESLSLSGSSGEVENLAGQMSGLLGQLSERARRFQAAWLNTDQENRELQHRLMLAEQKVYAVTGEKESLLNENGALRKNCSRVEGEKLAAVESHRTEIASLELKIREQESRNAMLETEVRSLKEELERARNDSTGSDLESRRARFELERITGELSAERQERGRLQRALENREKELQAMQAQSAGHASTLFLDELHRLVRRLESELDIRTSAAHEAMSVFDRMSFLPEQQMYAATLRTSISTACGLTPDEGDALKNLDQQSQIGQATLDPAPAPGADSFKTALERYDFARASGIASAQMRAGQRSPLEFMQELYGVEMLRRPEIGAKLDDLTALLRGIKTLQEASDRARGRESEQTERLFVLIFDLLHTLVRLKLISRATPGIWDLFLELRGRFSFLTSDRQWREYRDRIIGGNRNAVA